MLERVGSKLERREKEKTIEISRVISAVEHGIKDVVEKIKTGVEIKTPNLLIELQQKARELGVRPSDVHLAVSEAQGISSEGTVILSQRAEKTVGNASREIEPGQNRKFNIVLAGALLLAACDRGHEGGHVGSDNKTEQIDDTGDTSNDDTGETGDTAVDSGDDTGKDTGDTGDDTGSDTGEVVEDHDPSEITYGELSPIECDPPAYFDPNAEYTAPDAIADIHPPDCGIKPDHAPDECGQQQWLGYSEYNPAAVAWMAIANTGTEACKVTITRLELSYKTAAGEKELLSCGINWSQALSDGTKKEYGNWGTYIQSLGHAETFEIPPNTGAYVHPFGDMVLVPEDATEITITWSAEISEGCSASGGMDTYSEFANPDEVDHNIIYEAIKTPWVQTTIEPENPISYSINHVPTDSGESE